MQVNFIQSIFTPQGANSGGQSTLGLGQRLKWQNLEQQLKALSPVQQQRVNNGFRMIQTQFLAKIKEAMGNNETSARLRLPLSSIGMGDWVGKPIGKGSELDLLQRLVWNWVEDSGLDLTGAPLTNYPELSAVRGMNVYTLGASWNRQAP